MLETSVITSSYVMTRSGGDRCTPFHALRIATKKKHHVHFFWDNVDVFWVILV